MKDTLKLIEESVNSASVRWKGVIAFFIGASSYLMTSLYGYANIVTTVGEFTSESYNNIGILFVCIPLLLIIFALLYLFIVPYKPLPIKVSRYIIRKPKSRGDFSYVDISSYNSVDEIVKNIDKLEEKKLSNIEKLKLKLLYNRATAIYEIRVITLYLLLYFFIALVYFVVSSIIEHVNYLLFILIALQITHLIIILIHINIIYIKNIVTKCFTQVKRIKSK